MNRSIFRWGDGHGSYRSSIGLRGLVFAVCLFGAYAVVNGQPPPIGPGSYRQDKTDISVGVVKGFVKTQILQALANANTAIHVDHPNISVSLVGDVSFNSPYRIGSDSPNRPNQYYVKLPMHFKVNVDIPVVADRQLYYPLDLNFTCDKWVHGNGSVKITTVVGPPDIQGGSIVENLLMVRDLIDAKVKASLPQIGSMSQTLGAARCVDIGATPHGSTPSPDNAIVWDEPGRRIVLGNALTSRLTVTYLRLKRLQARGNGALLYSPTESIALNLYANYSESQKLLTMNEGDDVALDLPAVTFQPPYGDVLVIIANVVQQQNGYTEDTGFASSARANKFSPGVHTVQIPKTYIIQPGPGHTKPIIAHTPAYELTYRVDYVEPPTVLAQPTTPVRTTQ